MLNLRHVFISLFLILIFVSCGSENTSQSKETMSQSKKVLFVLTSHDQLGNTGEKTGFWIEEFASPYYFLKDKGVEITLASPKGGHPPIDPKSDAPESQTPSTVRFKADEEAKKQMANTLELASVNVADYDAVFYPGGHGPLWDLATDKNSIALIEAFYNSGKPVSAVCHAPAIFKETKAKDGSSLVKGKKVTGFSDTEEAAVQLTDVVPFLVEDMLKKNGGEYSKGADWSAYAVEDGLIITGQNPASSELVAEKLLAQLNK